MIASHLVGFEPVIGLEIHARLLTETKIFCGCSTRFGHAPNTSVCPVCLGFPGALPVLNRRAVDFAAKAALALNCTVHEQSIFARKNYFYPDLPKGYQISQYEQPLATGGRARIHRRRRRQACADHARAHGRRCRQVAPRRLSGLRAEDLPRLQSQRHAAHRDRHRARPAVGRRCGGRVPEAARDPHRARRERRQHGGGQPALRRQRVGAAGRVRDARHENGSEEHQLVPLSREGARVRNRAADRPSSRRAGRSCRKRGCGTRRRARPFRCAAKRTRTTIATFPNRTCRRCGWRAIASSEIRESIVELPEARRRRVMVEYALSEAEVTALENTELTPLFEETAKASGQPRAAFNWVSGEVARKLNELGERFDRAAHHRGRAGGADRACREGDDQRVDRQGRASRRCTTPAARAEDIVAADGLAQIGDEGALLSSVRAVIDANQDAVAQIRSGKTGTFGFLVGQVMKATGGKANPKLVNELLRQRVEHFDRNASPLETVQPRRVRAARSVHADREGRVRLSDRAERRRQVDVSPSALAREPAERRQPLRSPARTWRS